MILSSKDRYHWKEDGWFDETSITVDLSESHSALKEHDFTRDTSNDEKTFVTVTILESTSR